MHTTTTDHSDLDEALRRCTPETFAAAKRYRETGDVTAIPAIVFGIIDRYQPATAPVQLANADDTTRLIEDLGLDSLTLLEIVMSIEEVLQIRIANEELRGIRTLAQLNKFLAAKISGEEIASSEPVSSKKFTREQILLTLPQQPPFLFLDDASIDGNAIKASYTIRGDEYFLEGHFKGDPIFPASIVFEAMGQAACLWVLENAGGEIPSNQVFFASLEDAHFYRKTRPGDRLEFEQTLIQMHQPLAIFSGKVSCNGERVAAIERLTLAFGESVQPDQQKATPAQE
jgi:3-hydroxyacyl-[acyl-carrier-protein] dehydratase